MRKVFLAMAILLLAGISLQAAESISWDTDPTAAGGQRRGILVQQVDNNGNVIASTKTDSPLAITDNGGAITVDGTVTTTPSGKQVVQGGSGSDTPVYVQGTVTSTTPTNSAPAYQKYSDSGFWSSTRTDSSVLVADQVYTDTILTTVNTTSTDYRLTGISMGMWCSALWSIKINSVVVATGLCYEAMNFAFPTPIPVPRNALVQICYSMVKDSLSCRIIYTVYGDTR